MSDEEMPPSLDVHQDGLTVPTGASFDAITTLIHSFASMITAMERRLTERIQENASASKDRWERWEADFRDYRSDTNRRIEILEVSVHSHHEAAERDKLMWDARLGVVRSGTRFIRMYWRSIILVLFALLGAAGLATNVFEDVLRAVAK